MYKLNADDLDKLICKVNENKGKDEIQGELNQQRLQEVKKAKVVV